MDEFGKKRVVDKKIKENGFEGVGVGDDFEGMKKIVELMKLKLEMKEIEKIVN